MKRSVALVATAALLGLPACASAPAGGTLIVVLSSATTDSAAGSLQVHGAGGWITAGHFHGSVPAAPQSIEAASAELPAGSYDALGFAGTRLDVTLTIRAGLVEPVLIGVSARRPDAGEAYAGQDAVNLGLSEIAGRYARLPSVLLTDRRGATLRTAAWLGRPTVMAVFQRGAGAVDPYGALFGELARLRSAPRLVEIARDPTADTAPALAAYAREHAVSWTLATGAAAAVDSVLGVMGVPPEASSPGAVPVRTLVIVDAHGFVLDHIAGVPSAAQVEDALASVTSPLPPPGLNAPEPSFRVDAWSGGTLGPGSFGGRSLVINFWASWCTPCRTEMPLLQSSAARHPGVAFLFVDERDDSSSARAFVNALHLSATIASDPGGAAAAAFNVLGLPTTVFIASSGTVVAVQLGQLDGALLAQHLRDLAAA